MIAPVASPTGSKGQFNPRASADYLAWNEGRLSPWFDDIAALDLRTNTVFTVTGSPGDVVLNAVSGSIVVWTDFAHRCSTCDGDIWAKDLATGSLYSVASGLSDQVLGAVAGHTVAWVEGEQLLMADLGSSGVTGVRVVATATTDATLDSPVMSEDYLVWGENEESANYEQSMIHALDRRTGIERVIATSVGSSYPEFAIDGHRLVWSAYYESNLHVVDLSTGQSTELPVQGASVSGPAISGDYVTWSVPGDNFDIWGMKIPDGKPLPLVQGSGRKTGITVAGDVIAWQNEGGTYDGRVTMASLSNMFALAIQRDQALNPRPMPTQFADVRYFPETGHTLKGRFRQYWEANGGLQEQGYPISEEFEEASLTDGKVYTVQYFERAIFELHPEDQAPYDVLLSLLGVDEYKAQYPYSTGGAPGQRRSAENPLYFPETDHSVGGIFRQYWERHGGLAQQGYPISDEFAERNPLDGKTYIVQYFQRAVFELHPENAGTPYEVLLRQLGTLRYRQRYGAGPLLSANSLTPTPTPTLEPPAPAPVATSEPGSSPPGDLWSIDMTGTQEGWAVGSGGAILHYSGGRWASVTSPTKMDLTTVSMLSPDEGWAMGSDTLLHYSGGLWQEVANPLEGEGQLTALTMVPPDDGWLVSNMYNEQRQRNETKAVRFQNGQWQPFDKFLSRYVTSISILSHTDGWGVGPGVIAHYTGTIWQEVGPRDNDHAEGLGALTAISMVSPDEGWAVDNGSRMMHYAGRKWALVYSPSDVGLNAIRMVSAQDGWAMGWNGTILRYKDGFWALDASPTSHTLTALDFVLPTEAWAVGTSNTILHLDNNEWSVYVP